MKTRNNYFYFLLFSLFFLSLILAFSIFKNLQYGILWNDEAETAMYGKSIIAYGYPKVHFGKNVLNVSETKDLSIGIKKGSDAWIYISSWGDYYFATPFVFLADRFSDPYVKTFILRFPFAFLGYIGILVFAFAGSLFFKEKEKKILFVDIFIFFEILSIPLVLHLREMRHYSLTIFLISLMFLLNVKKLVAKDFNNLFFQISLFFLLLILMNVYLPAFLSSYIFLFLIFILELVRGKNFRNIFLKNLYLFSILIPLVFYLSFFEFFKISSAVSNNFSYNFGQFILNLKMAALFFAKSEYLPVSFSLLILLFFMVIKKKISLTNNLVLGILFIFLYILISLFVVSRIPYFFERYYIFLQPFFIMFLVLSIFVIFDFLVKSRLSSAKWGFLYLIFTFLIFNSVFKIDHIKGHIYELFHPFQGTMDHLVSYISRRYSDPSKLVIATNYEEYVLMYYLNAKVVVGYVGNNLESDLKETPDIIVIRKNRPNFVKELGSYFSKANYEKVVLDVYDYPVNNIPENTLILRHLYKPIKPSDDSERLTIFVRRI